MKKSLSLLLAILCFISCKTNSNITSEQADRDGNGISDQFDLHPEIDDYKMFNELNEKLETIKLVDSSVSLGQTVNVNEEMLELFNPDRFDCSCDEKLKKKIKKFNDKGFLPQIIEIAVPTYLVGNLINESGANALAHSFQLKKTDGTLTKAVFVNNAPTVNTFSQLDYLETRDGVFNNFYYSLDCSGYLTGVIKAGVGVNSNSIKSSASGASNSDKSLVVIKGVLYTPLYQAYKGEGKFKDDQTLRLTVLKAILSKIPTSTFGEDTELKINTNYKVLISSNSGNSSFNGEAELSASGGYNFLVGSIQADMSAKSTIARTSSFDRYKTYILEENIGALADKITIKDIKNLIQNLETDLAAN